MQCRGSLRNPSYLVEEELFFVFVVVCRAGREAKWISKNPVSLYIGRRSCLTASLLSNLPR